MIEIAGGLLVARRERGVEIYLGLRAADRDHYPNVWDMPGGHCEPGERPEQTLVRELQEEIGVTPTAWEPLGEFTVDGDTPLHLHVFAVRAWLGTPRNLQPEEHSDLRWFPLDEACALALAHPAYPQLFRQLAAEG